MAEIATYTMIKTKTSYGSTGTECPPKKIIKTISSYISIANESSYGDNEAVKLEDISASAYTFTVANNSKSIGAAGGNTSAVDFTSYKIVNGVQSNVSYSLTSTLPSWLTWNSSTRTFNVANNLGSQRIFTATFTQAESGKTVTASVTQAAVSQTYTFTVDGGTSSSAVFTSDGGSSTSFAFVSTVTTNGTTTNIAYTLTSTLPSWLTWDSVNRQFTATANVGAERTTTATFTQTNSNKMVSISVIQGAKEYIDWRFNIAGETVVNDTIGSDGGTLTYYVSSTRNGVDHGFRLTTSSGFMTPTQTGSGSQNITVTVSANTSSASRTDFIEYRQYDSESTIRINITQSGKPADQYVLQFTDGTTTTKSGTIPAKYSSNVNLISGGVESYKITSSGQEAVSYTYTKPSWITSVEIDSDMVLVTGFSENTSTSSRSGSIVITQSGSNNTLTINVTQSGKAADAYVFTVDGSTSTTKTISASGSNVTVSVVSTKNSTTQDWSITNISADWLTAIKENSNVKLTASSNYTSTNRTGIITLTQAGSSKTATITVNQQVSNEWTYTFEPVEKYKDKPTKITTGKNNSELYTQYTLYSYKQRSLNGIIVDDTQIYVKATYTTDFPSNYECTTSNIGNRYFITIKTPYTADNPAQFTHYGSFIFTQQDSGNIFKIDIMQVGGRDYRIGTYILPTARITDSNVKWYSASHEDLIVYKQGSSDKINGTEVVQSYVSVDIDANKITEDGYVLVSRNGDPTSSTWIGNYTCPSSIETIANWFTTNFDQSSSGYGKWYFIFPENGTGSIRNANVQINQQVISDEVTECSVYSNSPETIGFSIIQYAS